MAPKPYRDITDPEEPISLAEAREHLNLTPDVDSDDVESHPDDAQISAFLTAAREYAEFFTGCTIANREVQFSFDAFPEDGGELELLAYPVNALVGITHSQGSSSSDADQPAAMLDTESMPARLVLPSGSSWPAADDIPNAVTVTLDVGYLPAGDSTSGARPLPKALRAAILLLMAHLYENREASVEKTLQEIPFGVEVLLRMQRYRTGIA